MNLKPHAKQLDDLFREIEAHKSEHRSSRVAAAFLSVLLIVSNVAVGETAAAENCALGPLQKTFGGSQWLVYGCDDKKSAVIVTSPTNPAAPFYFFVSRKDGTYHVSGEGLGDKKLTDAAFNELNSLGDTGMAALVAEATKHP